MISTKDRSGKLIYVSDAVYDKISELADRGHRPKSTQIELILDYYMEHATLSKNEEA